MEKNSNIKESKGKITIFLICSLLFVLCFLLFWQAIYLPKDLSSFQEVLFKITQGQGAKEIAFNLEKQDLIKNDLLFRFYTFLKRGAGKLRAGTYLLSSSMSIPQICKKIISGDALKDKITIIEGWNLRDIAWYFENKGMFQAEELLELSESFKNNLEGYLFPDTYLIDRDTTFEEIVRIMLDNFDKKLSPELREEIKRQDKSIFEVITMASLLEKEVKTFEDRQIVAGILWKRLRNNMPLQIDATITYITGKKTTKISRTETEIDSPYNTYKYLGLPLGPICNPGLDSIKAAVYSKESEFWYYLSSPDGETIFSKTLEQHNIAKAKYL